VNQLLSSIPLTLTLVRLCSVPFIGYFLWQGYWLTGMILFACAAFTDVLDGFLARRWHAESVIGSILDPFADKCMKVTVFFVLALHALNLGIIPLWFAWLLLIKELCLSMAWIGAVVYQRLVAKRQSSHKRRFVVKARPHAWGKAAGISEALLVLIVLVELMFGFCMPSINNICIALVCVLNGIAMGFYGYRTITQGRV